MNSRQPKTIAFVPPRYVESSAGGAEVAIRFFAEKLRSLKGIPTEILTTCAEDHHRWTNDRPAGVSEKNGVVIRRFAVDERKDPGAYRAAVLKIAARQRLNAAEEEVFFDNNVNSGDLCRYVREHGDEYAFFVFTPYLFGTTVNGSKVRPEKSLIRPCFHNETYSRMAPVRQMFQRVRGVVCNSPPERELILRRGQVPPEKVFFVGEAVEPPARPADEDALPRLGAEKPYLFYCGRREPGKNFPLLLEMFREYKKQNRNSLRLVSAGTGEMDLLPSDRPHVADAGFVTEEAKTALYRNALLTCQPSTKESFSIAIGESWLQQRPVIVSRRSAVTDHWVRLSGGGFSFGNFQEFEETLNFALANEKTLDKMGKAGYEFSIANFRWDKVIDRFHQALLHFGYRDG
jgi:glycosyltransferase involved in cell wall biosynthesis